MNKTVKTSIYVVLLGCALWLAYSFRRDYAAISAQNPDPAPATTNEPAATGATGTKNTPELRNAMVRSGLGLFIIVVVGALLLAHDFSHYFAGRVDRLIFNDNLEGVKDPEYDQAEKVWANGNHLEAIQLMRDYLKKNPREQYVALRIAEVYEKDLGNYLAAALEYEELLKHKLPPERWGWAAIHLANLYAGKLSKSPQAIELLQRIVKEYGETAAAKKARERLIQEGVLPLEEAKAEEPPSHLPPGFTPKKS